MKLPRRKKPIPPVPLTQPEAPVNVLGDDLIDILAPAAMDFSQPDCVMFSPTEWLRAWYVGAWPKTLGYTHWRALLDFAGSLRVSLFLTPLKPQHVARRLERQATAIQTARFFRAQTKRDASPSEDDDYRAVQEERYNVEVKGEPFYFLSAVVGLTASSEEELAKLSRKLEDLCRDAGITLHRAVAEQDDGLLSLLPISLNMLGNHQRNVRLDTLTPMFPFVGDEIVAPDGLYYGYNITTGMSVVMDPFALENAHTIIIGATGSGKSYFMKDLIEQYLLMGARVFVTDIEDEYRLLCEDLGGVYLDMGIKSEHKINVLDPDPNDDEGLAGAYQSFKGWLVAALERGLHPNEIAALDRAYFQCFAKRGILKDDNLTLRREPPVLSDLHDELDAMRGDGARTLADALYPMAKGMESEAFNCRTNIGARTNPFVVFGLKSVQEPMRARRIRQVQQFTWNQMLRDRRRKVEIIDEAWYLLGQSETAKDVAERARRFRKKNAALVLATQFASDFAANRHAEVVLNQAATHLLFGQRPTSVDQVAQLFKLNDSERIALGTLERGQYFLKTSRAQMLMHKPSPEERQRMYTTKPEEVERALAERGHV